MNTVSLEPIFSSLTKITCICYLFFFVGLNIRKEVNSFKRFDFLKLFDFRVSGLIYKEKL